MPIDRSASPARRPVAARSAKARRPPLGSGGATVMSPRTSRPSSAEVVAPGRAPPRARSRCARAARWRSTSHQHRGPGPVAGDAPRPPPPGPPPASRSTSGARPADLVALDGARGSASADRASRPGRLGRLGHQLLRVVLPDVDQADVHAASTASAAEALGHRHHPDDCRVTARAAMRSGRRTVGQPLADGSAVDPRTGRRPSGRGRAAQRRNDGTSKSSSPRSSSSSAASAKMSTVGRRFEPEHMAARPRRATRWPTPAPAAVLPALEPGGDDRDPHLVAHVVVDDRPEDDVGVGVGHRVDDLGRLVHLEQAEIRARRRC